MVLVRVVLMNLSEVLGLIAASFGLVLMITGVVLITIDMFK